MSTLFQIMEKFGFIFSFVTDNPVMRNSHTPCWRTFLHMLLVKESEYVFEDTYMHEYMNELMHECPNL